MPVAELIQFLAHTLADHDLRFETVNDQEIHRGCPACLIVLRGRDCKIQQCWSAYNDAIGTEMMSWLRDLSLEYFDSARRALKTDDWPITAEVPPCLI